MKHEHALATERMPIEELEEAARGEGIDDLAKVKAAILETNGRISFLQERRPRLSPLRALRGGGRP